MVCIDAKSEDQEKDYFPSHQHNKDFYTILILIFNSENLGLKILKFRARLLLKCFFYFRTQSRSILLFSILFSVRIIIINSL